MKPTIGITGGTGYIGSSLAYRLSKKYQIIALDIKEPNGQLPENVSFTKCDITNGEEVKRAIEDTDVVIHTSIIQIPAINDHRRLGYEVNVIGTQNICQAVENNEKTKGLILSGSWHTIGEKELKGVINEEFGFRPDKVEERARLYALSKMAQESIVRFYDEMTDKIFGIIRMGTVLGEGMPPKTAANIFIENGLNGKPLTPFKQSMYRPMLYVDINDICMAYEKFVEKILSGNLNSQNSAAHIFNVYYHEPITIYELAKMTQEAIFELTNGKIQPKIDVIDNNQPSMFQEKDKDQITVDAKKAMDFLQLDKLKSPKESTQEIIKNRLAKQ
ncbi:MAG: NAD-dependent epimerase/dehydratase family protein [Bacillota bacterium]|jgi:nucleoside-diphosphate-sugar epimerase